ncbi:HD domain-containing protein [Patescibacteria group bacterium]|nr:HD domain-containing protein [Patescibacteria group bacterium]MBU4600454.1 HD domain-containing protein [Patescibacteria group bacterium]MCG2698489.1 HD domain-containing protein [Candidatus Parcubacteria bacterium]
MRQETLLKRLQEKSKEIMGEGKHFHDFAHVIGVYRNVEKLLEHEQGNRLILLTAALFHDVKRNYQSHGAEGAKYVKELLKLIPEFPQDLIDSVVKIIDSHDKEQKTQNEKLFYDADKMDAFNELATARSFMMYSKEGLSLEEACFKYLDLIDNFFNKLHTDTAKKIIKKEYEKTKQFALKLVKRYER